MTSSAPKCALDAVFVRTTAQPTPTPGSQPSSNAAAATSSATTTPSSPATGSVSGAAERETPATSASSAETSAAAPIPSCISLTTVHGMGVGGPTVRGYDFNKGLDYDALFASMKFSGFQATNLGLAIEEINKMLHWRSTEPDEENERCKIYLGYTSNMISCGMREIIRYLTQHRLVDVIVTTTGGIEEDFIKCLAPTIVGDFTLDGATLRERGLNRIGNLLIPNDNYCLFEDWLMPILDKMVEDQAKGTHWTPSRFIDRLGKEINNPDSVYYWCHKNNIPVFCPALTDGSIGDMIYFHSYKTPGLIIDLVDDIREMNNSAVFAKQTGMIICGGGVIKHHINNANLMRNGADYAVYINTANEFDGSDAGARTDEAVSWGKIKPGTSAVKVYSDFTLVLPYLVAQTFVKFQQEKEKEEAAKEAAKAAAKATKTTPNKS
ncbi:deoxyhypusine synthase [Pelomyxa schiedti]|nr:deoxyhypusine synthase [Pelomyxa schiedti]